MEIIELLKDVLVSLLFLLPGFHINNLVYLIKLNIDSVIRLAIIQNFYEIFRSLFLKSPSENFTLISIYGNRKLITSLVFISLISFYLSIILLPIFVKFLQLIKPIRKDIGFLLFIIVYLIYIHKNLQNKINIYGILTTSIISYLTFELEVKDPILLLVLSTFALPLIFFKDKEELENIEIDRSLKYILISIPFSLLIVLIPATSPLVISYLIYLIFKNKIALYTSLIFTNIVDPILSTLYFSLYGNSRLGALSLYRKIDLVRGIKDILTTSFLIPIILILIITIGRYIERIYNKIEKLIKIIVVISIILVNTLINGILSNIFLFLNASIVYVLLKNKADKQILINLFYFRVFLYYLLL